LRTLLASALVAAAALAAGCSFTRPAPVKQAYLLEAQRAPEAAPPAFDGTLRVGMFGTAPAFAGEPMVYRFDEHRYDADFYNEWFVAPRDLVSQRVFEWMQNARVYASTLPATGEGPRPAPLLSGLVTEMYGDLRDPSHPAAVLAIQFYITQQGRDANGVLLAQQLRQVVPMTDASASALATGLSTALTNILAEFERQVRAAAPGRTDAR
jgi:hypothetical protein